MPPKPRSRSQRKTDPPTDPLPPPAHLSPDAAQVWRETVALLAAPRAADALTLETLVFAVVRQRRIQAEIEAGALIDDEGKVYPLLRLSASTASTVKAMARELGLTHAGRQRAPQAQPKGDGIWADME
jgi:phage terminase small subunit